MKYSELVQKLRLQHKKSPIADPEVYLQDIGPGFIELEDVRLVPLAELMNKGRSDAIAPALALRVSAKLG